MTTEEKTIQLSKSEILISLEFWQTVSKHQWKIHGNHEGKLEETADK